MPARCGLMREAGITLTALGNARATATECAVNVRGARRFGSDRLQFFGQHGNRIEERAMAKDPFEQFAVPSERRAFAERSVAQARQAFEGFVEAATKAVGQMHGSAQAAHSGASEIAQKSISYAEQNMAATFDFAQKLMKAKDGAEVLGLQSEFLSRQMQSLSTQVKDLGQSAAKI